MNRFLLIALIPALLLAAPHRKHTRTRAAAHKPLGPVSVIRDVSVVDVLTGKTTPHQDITLRGERIEAIRKTAAPGKTTRYAIPGLWDMHVHLFYSQNQFPLYIANGVTGLRNMGSDYTQVRKWEREIAKGSLIGPRLFTSGAAISTSTAPSDSHLPMVVVHSPDDARRAFNVFYDQEVNFIKILDIPENAYEALAELSRHDGVPIAGHLPDSVSAFTAAADRMSSMEHLFGIAIACSSKESVLRNKLILAKDKKDWNAAAEIQQQIIDTYDPALAAQLFDAFRRYDVRQTPTLTLWSRMSRLEPAEGTTAPELRYVDPAIRREWKTPEDQTKDLTALAQRQDEFARKITGEMARAGVSILAGTDTGDPWTVPGFELHKELAMLVDAGLTPAQALRSATSEPARLIRRPNDLGQVKAGFIADLVVLDANPLADIHNTRQIDAVYLKGKRFDRIQLRQMLSQAALAGAGKNK